jgi:mRNA-degrading endonuclease toxin of MazEF toxin-antitoxin module
MKAWEIYSYKHPDWPEPHPAVIVSHPDRVAMKPEITILLCSSKKATRSAKPHEVILDSSDGLDWPTLCKCDLLYTLSKTALKAQRGTVTAVRRRQIVATINRAMGWI